VAQEHGQGEQVELVQLPMLQLFTITASATATASATHFAVFTSSTGGDKLFYGELSTAKTIADGDEVKFNASALTLTVA
jgi:hypothetical protein